MRDQVRGKGKVVSVGTAQVVHDHPARADMVALMDDKLFAQRLKSERSSAYWFAASLWGVTGLVMGIMLGGFVMFTAMRSSMPLASEAVSRGMAVEQARERAERAPSLLTDPASPDPQQEP